MRLRSLLFGCSLASYLSDENWSVPVLLDTGGFIPRHRSPGGRAHRRWRRERAAGMRLGRRD